MFKFCLSIRGYKHGRMYIPPVESWDTTPHTEIAEACRMAGVAVAIHKRGNKTAIELLRAGGMGVYGIASIVKEIDLSRIRSLCEYYDKRLHEQI